MTSCGEFMLTAAITSSRKHWIALEVFKRIGGDVLKLERTFSRSSLLPSFQAGDKVETLFLLDFVGLHSYCKDKMDEEKLILLDRKVLSLDLSALCDLFYAKV